MSANAEISAQCLDFGRPSEHRRSSCSLSKELLQREKAFGLQCRAYEHERHKSYCSMSILRERIRVLPMLAFKDGRFVCYACAHTVRFDSDSYRCICRQCTRIA